MKYKEVSLGDISIGNKGNYGIGASAVDYSENLFTYLRITDINDNGTINKEGLKSVDDNKAEQYLLEPNDIVIARTGNSTGRSYFYERKDGQFVYAGFLIKFSLDPAKINPKYMKYYTLSLEYKNWIESVSTGSTRKNINAKMYSDMKINLPSREQQNLLVDTLSSLDNKIETNNKINKNLEQQAQEIFKHWFVDFEFPDENGNPYKSSGGKMVESELGMIPKGWESKIINDLCEVTSSKRIFRKEYSETGIPFYRGKEIIEKNKGNAISTELFITIKRYNEIKEKFSVPKEKDILLTSVGTLGISYQVRKEKFYFKDGNITWFKNFKDDAYKNYIYIFLNNDIGKQAFDKITIGSTQKALTITSLKNIPIVLSDENILKKFDFISSNILDKIYNNNLENQALSNLRDTLLPKLMSGEIRIPLD